jgi:predicted ATPase
VKDAYGNLPAYVTPLIGRQEELAELQTLIHNPDCRLITILGPGGIGKTRLAIACARQELKAAIGDEGSHPFPDGVCFVRLESIDDAGQITREIAQALNLSVLSGEQADGWIDQQLLGYLHRKRMLLVLDNFEQLLAGVQTIAELLQAAPGVRTLITSRERLRLQGEQVFPIEGLTYPRLATMDDPGSYTAIQLFIHSARRQHPEFELTAEKITALVQICHLLDGMPLGLELAASWVGLLTLEEINAEIQKNIGFLESDWVDLPDRHRSLLAVCETIWQLLQPAEQTLFARLYVFRGGFTRVAARKVAAAAVRDLQALRNKSILDYDRVHQRYRIHPYLRQYGAERLSKNPQEEFQTRDAHSAFFCAELEKQGDIYESGCFIKLSNR